MNTMNTVKSTKLGVVAKYIDSVLKCAKSNDAAIALLPRTSLELLVCEQSGTIPYIEELHNLIDLHLDSLSNDDVEGASGFWARVAGYDVSVFMLVWVDDGPTQQGTGPMYPSAIEALEGLYDTMESDDCEGNSNVWEIPEQRLLSAAARLSSEYAYHQAKADDARERIIGLRKALGTDE